MLAVCYTSDLRLQMVNIVSSLSPFSIASHLLPIGHLCWLSDTAPDAQRKQDKGEIIESVEESFDGFLKLPNEAAWQLQVAETWMGCG